MSKKFIFILLLVNLIPKVIQADVINFKDNSDVSLTLSHNNYNRLTVKGDKITKAYFPPHTLGVSNDEDGSLYITLNQELANNAQAFTLFIATEKGHHFSATVTSEDSLGKTIEFIPQRLISDSILSAETNHHISENPVAQLLSQIINKKIPQDFTHEHFFNRSTRLNPGIFLTHKESYKNSKLNAEVLELYNFGAKPLNLEESWFLDKNVIAISLSQKLLLPKQSTLLYRIKEV